LCGDRRGIERQIRPFRQAAAAGEKYRQAAARRRLDLDLKSSHSTEMEFRAAPMTGAVEVEGVSKG
jgi:hypothetical protein